ncbi:tetratricopeptide repeat protein [Mobilicoccus massiliensis]|uniref:tetratricopeptide repeat protein n=1 Tax=Mobilicoccus massiliensis TaxID=1522310 RepID=UPI000B037DD0|nr:tetratricopeptide repeat protein [Mobilicoccus massiliensis]
MRTLSKDNAKGVGAHLIMVARLIDEDIDLARAHADAAVRRAGRVPSVREARGMVAYQEGDWSVALAEFRTARRLSGSHHLLPYLIDCERALGRPEKALELARSAEVDTLGPAERIEVAIVTSGIRRDLGQPEAALTELEGRHLVPGRTESWAPRLYYAYADALLDLGRTDEARRWFQAAADVDTELQTDAWERLDELDGTVVVDLMDDADEDDDPVNDVDGPAGATGRSAEFGGVDGGTDVDDGVVSPDVPVVDRRAVGAGESEDLAADDSQDRPSGEPDVAARDDDGSATADGDDDR